MTTTNLCLRLSKERAIGLHNFAKRMEADEMIIHPNGSVTLLCEFGGICSEYFPTASEMRKCTLVWRYDEDQNLISEYD